MSGDSASLAKKQLFEMDLYMLLGIDDESIEFELLRKAYRKKALELHPDKQHGADDKAKDKAQENFVLLGKAFEILADEAARAAYDSVRKAKRDKIARDSQMDGKRRKLKEDLESRERAAQQRYDAQTDKLERNNELNKLEAEIERLRSLGSKLLEQEMNYVNEMMKKEKKNSSSSRQPREGTHRQKESSPSQPIRLKVSWSKSSSSDLNEDLLRHLFEKYGDIDVLVVMSKKSRAILEFRTREAALKCLKDEGTLNESYAIKLKKIGCETEEKERDKEEDVVVEDIKKAGGGGGEQELDMDNFEEMEMAILKKLKASGS